MKLDDFDGDLVFYCRLDSAITSRIFWNGLYSRSSLIAISKLLDRESVVFDIGANEGEHTVFCAKRVPAGKVYAFEPNPAVRAHLVRNVSANDFANVVVVPIALADRAGELPLFGSQERISDGTLNEGLGTLYPRAGVSEAIGVVPLDTLDHFVSEQNIPRVDLIKIDVEGAEFAVLSGAKETLTRFRPALVLEVEDEPARASGHSTRELLDLVSSFGYTIFNIRESGRLFPFRGRPTRDVLCIPQPSLDRGDPNAEQRISPPVVEQAPAQPKR